MTHVVVEHADINTRACVDSSAVEHYRLRGWTPVGPAAEPGSTETVVERDKRIVAEAAAERALLEQETPAEPEPEGEPQVPAEQTPGAKPAKPSTRRGR